MTKSGPALAHSYQPVLYPFLTAPSTKREMAEKMLIGE